MKAKNLSWSLAATLVLLCSGMLVQAQTQNVPAQQELFNWMGWANNEGASIWMTHHPLHLEWSVLLRHAMAAVKENELIWNETLEEANGCFGSVLRARMGTNMSNKTNAAFPKLSALYTWIFDRGYNSSPLAFANLMTGAREEYPEFMKDMITCLRGKMAARLGFRL